MFWLTTVQILTVDDGTFPALLKTLSDPSDAVVTRDLLLLSQISMHSDDTYFTSFMVNLLKLFCTDRKLLETRGNLIIRQLCLTLSAEKIYRTMADCIVKDEDVEFASIMVQNLNNNLITAPELADLRRRLRNLDSKVCDVTVRSYVVVLIPSRTVNRSSLHYSKLGVTTRLRPSRSAFSLRPTNRHTICSKSCMSPPYIIHYNTDNHSADLEMTVNTLIQIDKLVQLLESPVFTCMYSAHYRQKYHG